MEGPRSDAWGKCRTLVRCPDRKVTADRDVEPLNKVRQGEKNPKAGADQKMPGIRVEGEPESHWKNEREEMKEICPRISSEKPKKDWGGGGGGGQRKKTSNNNWRSSPKHKGRETSWRKLHTLAKSTELKSLRLPRALQNWGGGVCMH